jgi:hypothetical protein
MSEDEEYIFTHKRAFKNLLFVLFLMTLVLCTGLSWIVSEIGNDPFILEGAFVGFLTGLLLVIFSNILFWGIWDPVTLQYKEKGLLPSCGFGCILPISLIVVIITGFLIVRTLGFSFQGWLFTWIITSGFVFVSYMIFQIWRSKPKE